MRAYPYKAARRKPLLNAMSVKTKALSEKIGHIRLPKPLRVQAGDSLKDVISQMREKRAGTALVCQGGKILGIFTERDFLMKVLNQVKDPELPIKNFMSPKVTTITRDTSLGEAVELMHVHGYRNLPVVDDKDAPVALVSVRQIIKYLAAHFPAEVMNLPPEPEKVSESPEVA